MTATSTRHAGPFPAASVRSALGDTSTDSTDEVLIKRIAQHDRLAMRTLFARHQVPIYRFVFRLVRDAAIAEDVLSEVFLEVWRHASRFRGESSVSTWLLAIARFRTMSELRRRREEEELDFEMADTLPDPSPGPELLLQQKQTTELLCNALNRLSPAHAEVIDLVYYHGKSVKDVAQITGLPAATVKTRMFYARKKLEHVARAVAA